MFSFKLDLTIVYGALLTMMFSSMMMSCKDSSTSSDESDDGSSKSIFDVFYNESIVDITISTSLDTLDLNKKSETYQPAKIAFKDDDGSKKSFDIEISSRGETRKRYCSIFPLHLKFAEELLAKTRLAKYKKVKLVRPCGDNKTYIEYILREYICYKLYRVFTDQSFRTQMAKVTLKDNSPSSDSSYESHYTFLIEDKKQVAKRLGKKIIKRDHEPPRFYNQRNYAMMTLFQYMIGNTDWNIKKQHNLRLFQASDEESAIMVPYDFDYSGLVNADYAIPYPNKPGRTVKDRFFQWQGKDEELFKECVKIFRGKKKDILAIVNTCPYSSDSSKESMRAYILSFYEQIESKNVLELLKASTKI